MPVAIRIEGTNIDTWLRGIIEEEKENLKSDYRAAVVPRTPIDTGRARRGWQARTNEIRNDVPYIKKLEGGSSRQAPSGFVNQAMSITIDKSNRRKY